MDPEPDQDPLVRCTDPGIGIRTKMSRIHNTEIFNLDPDQIRVLDPDQEIFRLVQ